VRTTEEGEWKIRQEVNKKQKVAMTDITRIYIKHFPTNYIYQQIILATFFNNSNL